MDNWPLNLKLFNNPKNWISRHVVAEFELYGAQRIAFRAPDLVYIVAVHSNNAQFVFAVRVFRVWRLFRFSISPVQTCLAEQTKISTPELNSQPIEKLNKFCVHHWGWFRFSFITCECFSSNSSLACWIFGKFLLVSYISVHLPATEDYVDDFSASQRYWYW